MDEIPLDVSALSHRTLKFSFIELSIMPPVKFALIQLMLLKLYTS